MRVSPASSCEERALARVSKDGRESMRRHHPSRRLLCKLLRMRSVFPAMRSLLEERRVENERKLKKWSRAKKEAFIRGEFESLQQLAKRKSPHPSRRPPAAGSSGLSRSGLAPPLLARYNL